MGHTGSGSWETDSLLYTWVEMPVMYAGVILYWVSMVGCRQQGLQGGHCKECPGLPRARHSRFWALQPREWHLGEKVFYNGSNAAHAVRIEGKTWEKQPWRDQNERRGRERGAPEQEQRFSCCPWRRPWWGMGKVWGGRSDAVELLWTDSNPHSPSSASCKEEEAEELGMKEWCGAWEKGRFGRGAGVFSFVFVSYHSIQLLKHWINFPQVKSVLLVTVTGGNFPVLISTHESSHHIFWPVQLSRGLSEQLSGSLAVNHCWPTTPTRQN